MRKEQPKRPCAWCERVFRPLSQAGLYCTLGCRDAARRERLGLGTSTLAERTCIQCGKVYMPHHHCAKYCSAECKSTGTNAKKMQSYHRTRTPAKARTRQCLVCSKAFDVRSHALRALTCSAQCSYLLSRKRTAEAAAMARQDDPEITHELDKLYRDRSRGAPGGRLTPRAKACKICGQAIDAVRYRTVCGVDCAGQARGYRVRGGAS